MTTPGIDTCPECEEALLREEADIGYGTIYDPPWCSDPECGWELARFELPPKVEKEEKT